MSFRKRRHIDLYRYDRSGCRFSVSKPASLENRIQNCSHHSHPPVRRRKQKRRRMLIKRCVARNILYGRVLWNVNKTNLGVRVPYLVVDGSDFDKTEWFRVSKTKFNRPITSRGAFQSHSYRFRVHKLLTNNYHHRNTRKSIYIVYINYSII